MSQVENIAAVDAVPPPGRVGLVTSVRNVCGYIVVPYVIGRAFSLVTFSQNIGVLGLTLTRSRCIATAAGVFLVVLGLFPPLGRLVAAIPGPIIGDVALVMFTAIGVVGIKFLNHVDIHQPQNLFIVATSLGIGFVPMVAPNFYASWPKNLQTIFNSP